jgi:large subunit ribosomal protein L32
MPVPKQRHTTSRRNKRRSHLKIKKIDLRACSHCGEPVLPHNLCSNCGYYKDIKRVDVLAKLDKKEKKEKSKQLAKEEKDTKANKPLDLSDLSKKH